MPKEIEYNYNQSGWMHEDNFRFYLEHVVHKQMKLRGTKFPIICFLDNHASHVSVEISNLCEKLEIILITLYPNATNVIQPLDVAVFFPLKRAWTNFLMRLRNDLQLANVNHENIGELLLQFFNETNQKEWIESGFKTTGIFPWDANNIIHEDINSSCLRKKNVNEKVILTADILNQWRQKNKSIIDEFASAEDDLSRSSVLSQASAELTSGELSIMSAPQLSEQHLGEPLDRLETSDEPSNMRESLLTEKSNHYFGYEFDPGALVLFESSVPLGAQTMQNDSFVQSETSSHCFRNLYIDNEPNCNSSPSLSARFASAGQEISLESTNEGMPPTDQSFQNKDVRPAHFNLDPVNIGNGIFQPLSSRSYNDSDSDEPMDLSMPENMTQKPHGIGSIEDVEQNSEKSIYDTLKVMYGPLFKKFNQREFTPNSAEEDLLQRILSRYRPKEKPEDVLTLPPSRFRLNRKNVGRQPYVVSDKSFRKYRGKIEQDRETARIEKEKVAELKRNKKAEEVEEKAQEKAREIVRKAEERAQHTLERERIRAINLKKSKSKKINPKKTKSK